MWAVLMGLLLPEPVSDRQHGRTVTEEEEWWGLQNWVLLKKKSMMKCCLFMVFLWSGIFKLLRISGIDSKEPITPANVAWGRIIKILRSPRIDSK